LETYDTIPCRGDFKYSPYSLGKLIDWKLGNSTPLNGLRKGRNLPTPYSLGKLIDWKQKIFEGIWWVISSVSLLVREIN
jgi:hypothetical protein